MMPFRGGYVNDKRTALGKLEEHDLFPKACGCRLVYICVCVILFIPEKYEVERFCCIQQIFVGVDCDGRRNGTYARVMPFWRCIDMMEIVATGGIYIYVPEATYLPSIVFFFFSFPTFFLATHANRECFFCSRGEVCIFVYIRDTPFCSEI